jgi:hypothetical protein
LDSDFLDQILTQHNHQNFISQQNVQSVDSLNDEIMDPDQWEEQRPYYTISEFQKRLSLPQHNRSTESDLENRNQVEVTTNNNITDRYNNDAASDTQNTLTATVPHDDELTLSDNDHKTFPLDIIPETFHEKRTEAPHQLQPLSLTTIQSKTNTIQTLQDEVKGNSNSKDIFKENNSTPAILPNLEDNNKTHNSRTQTPKSEMKNENESPDLSTQEVINKMKEELRYMQVSQELGIDGNFKLLLSFVNPQEIETYKNSTPNWMNIETFLEFSVCFENCCKTFV